MLSTYSITALNILMLVILNSVSDISKICAISECGYDNCFISSDCFFCFVLFLLFAWLIIVC